MSAPEPESELRRIGLGLGANLGDREGSLRRAVTMLGRAGLIFDALSSLYATKPWGVVDQPDFINACALARTTLAPPALLDLVKATERSLGRQETGRWGPRIIDIDLLFYEDWSWRDDNLILPHPGVLERAFVLAPLAEIAPDLAIAGQGVAEAAATIERNGITRVSSFWAK